MNDAEYAREWSRYVAASQDRMGHFDKLPKAVRQAITLAPKRPEIHGVRSAYSSLRAEWGSRRAQQMVIAMIASQTPGVWTPMSRRRPRVKSPQSLPLAPAVMEVAP